MSGADTTESFSLFAPGNGTKIESDAPSGIQEGHRVIPLGQENGSEGLVGVLSNPTISVVQGEKDTEMYKPPVMTTSEREAMIANKRALAIARRSARPPLPASKTN